LEPNGTGFLNQREMRFLGLTNLTVNYVMAKATADRKSFAQVIDDLARKELFEGQSG